MYLPALHLLLTSWDTRCMVHPRERCRSISTTSSREGGPSRAKGASGEVCTCTCMLKLKWPGCSDQHLGYLIHVDTCKLASFTKGKEVD